MVRKVLISGATKGIGLATTHLLVQRGYAVVGIARSKPDAPYPGRLYECDLSCVDATTDILREIVANEDIDAIVNNAGITKPQYLGEIDFETLHHVLDFNIRPAIQIVQAFLPSMKAKKYGRIVNISSRAVFGSKKMTAYSIAKAGMLGATRTWAKELAPFNITVNAVAPGPVDTDLLRSTKPQGSIEEENMLSSILLNRVGTPEEIAGSIAYLLSEEAGFMTGETLHVNGGRL